MNAVRTYPHLHASLLLLACCALTAQAQALQRRAGLWSMTAQDMPMAMRQCVGTSGDDLAQARPTGGNNSVQCDSPNWQRDSSTRVMVSARCRSHGTTTLTKMVYTGDFNRAFNAEITMHQESPRTSEPDMVMRAAYRWEGACPAGVRPGQMVMPNGQVIDPAAMAARRR